MPYTLNKDHPNLLTPEPPPFSPFITKSKPYTTTYPSLPPSLPIYPLLANRFLDLDIYIYKRKGTEGEKTAKLRIEEKAQIERYSWGDGGGGKELEGMLYQRPC